MTEDQKKAIRALARAVWGLVDDLGDRISRTETNNINDARQQIEEQFAATLPDAKNH